MPDSAVYLPQAEVNGSDAAGTSSRFKAWFGLTTEPEDVEERDAERATGVVKKTRRMEKNEAGFPFREAPVPQ
jgi:hypothetical protein